jgi:cell division protein FtsL
VIAAPRIAPAPERRPHPIRRRRIQPSSGRALVAGCMLLALLLANVWLTTVAAERGYRLRALREEVGRLQEEHTRLQAEVAALRDPERIERLAEVHLGLRPPAPHQQLVLTLPLPESQDNLAHPDEPLWRRLVTWLREGVASAQERR